MSEGWVESGYINDVREGGGTSQDIYRPSTALMKGALQRLSAGTCVDANSKPFPGTRSELVLVTAQEPEANVNPFGKLTDRERFVVDEADYCGNTQSYQWMCNQYQRTRVQTTGKRACATAICDDLLPQLREDASCNSAET